MTWHPLTEQGHRCATVRCSKRAVWRLETGGVGSSYCDDCKQRIDGFDDDLTDGDGEWCEHCQNTGELDCYCGGDLCVCDNNGSYPCPHCQ
jgi:hypothetical protein